MESRRPERHRKTDEETSAESRKKTSRVRRGLGFSRRFTSPGIHPFDEIRWKNRQATIRNDKGDVIFEQDKVEMPAGWSQLATNVVASKYFRGYKDTADRENSLKQVISRVVGTIAAWGRQQGVFATEADSETFEAELTYILLNQMASFNSPVWFNVGIDNHPQCSACFINSIEDTMESIMELAGIEATLFKGGSGSGTNFSSIRSSKERLTGGGFASGPVSFMKGFDSFAGVIKSGGKTRRAAKMVILNVDHPDILEFVGSKAHEEKKAWSLIEDGYDGSINGEAYNSIFFQNANNSIRVTDEFMEAVVNDRKWDTHSITTGEVIDTYKAREIFQKICEAAHVCGDPGLQFDTTINRWNTCSESGKINASNPCSEYMFLDDSACNLASLNLMAFVGQEGEFDLDSFRHAIDLCICAQEIIVSSARYPTEKIRRNSETYRPLGLGYANLGALLMSRGLPYDSSAGRAYAAVVSALLSGEAYAMSARMAERLGPFDAFETNREPMLEVMGLHRKALDKIDPALAPPSLLTAARNIWDEVRVLGDMHGFRNAQVSVLAPTGTIAFMMDCDTTGIEPDIALVKYKKLVDGGILKIVNNTVPRALGRLGYTSEQISEIVKYIEAQNTIEGAPEMKEEHLPVFDCAFRAERGVRYISPMGHMKMMAAVQPFISGAISKTVNLPHEYSQEQIEDIFLKAWELGVKSITIYRDGSKRTQPLSTSEKAERVQKERMLSPELARRRMPDERRSITHKFSIGGHEGYLTVGIYDDGNPGEIFIRMAKEGSVVSGLMDSFATAISLALQYGVPLKVLVDKFSHSRFEPSGITTNPAIPIAKSVMDYIFRWLELKFNGEGVEEQKALTDSIRLGSKNPDTMAFNNEDVDNGFVQQADAPPCHQCGSIMVRNGSCYRCLNCGVTSGCS